MTRTTRNARALAPTRKYDAARLVAVHILGLLGYSRAGADERFRDQPSMVQ